MSTTVRDRDRDRDRGGWQARPSFVCAPGFAHAPRQARRLRASGGDREKGPVTVPALLGGHAQTNKDLASFLGQPEAQHRRAVQHRHLPVGEEGRWHGDARDQGVAAGQCELGRPGQPGRGERGAQFCRGLGAPTRRCVGVKRRHYEIGLGSTIELAAAIDTAWARGLMSEPRAVSLLGDIDRVGAMFGGLLRSARRVRE